MCLQGIVYILIKQWKHNYVLKYNVDEKIKRSLINLNTLKMYVHPMINDTPYVVIGMVLFMKRLQLKRH